MISLDDVKRILIVRNDNIGDLILTTPAIEALRKRFPDAYIAILVAEYAKDAIEGCPYLDKVYSYQKAKHSRHNRFIALWKQYKVIREMRKEKFDLAIGIRSSFSSSQGWLVFASGAPIRLGHYPKHKKYLSFFYNIYADENSRKAHEVMRTLNLLKKVKRDIVENNGGGKELFLHVTDDERLKASEFIENNRLKDGKKLICLHISRRIEEGRWWDIKNYIALADLLASRDNTALVLNCHPKEKELADEILSRMKKRAPVFISEGIKTLAAFLSECELFITLEGGSMHIAAAVKTPTVVIFGKTDPDVWMPWGEGHIVLKRGDNPNSVTVEDVINVVDKILGEVK